MKKVLKLFSADENFVRPFLKEKNRLEKILDQEIFIEHVGSTAVPGLGGKGIIDVAIGVKGKSSLQPVACELIKAGYFADLDNKTPADRIFLSSREHDSTLGDYHLHIVVMNGDEWRRLIYFRDQLRTDKKLRNEYMSLKRRLLVETKADREKYRKLKNDFIQKVLKEL